MKIKELKSNDIKNKKRIDSFLSTIKNVDVKQTTQWNELRDEKKYFLYLENNNNQIILSCNAFEIFDKELKEKMLYFPRGPVFDDKYLKLKDCIKYISKFSKEKQIKYIRLNPNISKEKHCYDELIKLGYNIRFISENDYRNLMESPREAILKIYDISKEDLLNHFHHKTRYNIRKSIKNKLDLKISKNINLENFYNLYIQTAIRHNFNPHPITYFEKLIELFYNKIVFCTVSYNNEPLAISINIIQSNTLYYLYGSSSDNNKNLFATYRMHWGMINYAMDNNLEYYNFGGVFSDDNDVNNDDYGLLIFKSRFCYNGLMVYNPDAIVEL